jgi:hypothetical protein
MPNSVNPRQLKRRLRFKWWAVKRWYYSLRHGLPVGGCGSMLPQLGRGEFVSVRQHGPYLDMRDERTGDLIRLVPYQPNHGVMIELWVDGRMRWRSHCDMDQFKAMGFGEAQSVAS